MKILPIRSLLVALILCVLISATIKTLAQTPSNPSAKPWPPNAAQYRFHMIGNSHIDAVWLWTWPEGMSAVVSAFRSALERMKEDPEFTFTASSAQFYEWVAATDPALIRQIRARVEEGRWALVGGWWVEPDINMPNGEALVRQGLYGQRLFQHLFGRKVEIGWNPDSFGHPGTLPQILRLQGLKAYVFMRPQPQEKVLPSDLFQWEGADGTRILAYHIPIAYGDYDGPIVNRVRRIISDLPEPTKDLMAFYGAGDHGGGPTKANIQSIREARQETGAPQMIFSTPYKYFEEVEKQEKSGVRGPESGVPNPESRTPSPVSRLPYPVLADDLQHHSVGCYTAISEVKKNNRAAEIALATGEKFAALGSVIAGFDYPWSDFAAAWKKVLFLQFHDSLAGSALPAHYEMARQGHGYAMEVATQAMYRAVEKISWRVPTLDPNSEYLVVFNPHAWDANLNVEYELGWEWTSGATPESIQRYSSLEDDRDNPVAHQWTQASVLIDDRNTLAFRAPVPAFGYRQFRLRKVPAKAPAVSPVRAAGHELENEHLRVSIADDGTLRIFDKDAHANVFRGTQGGARAVVLDDPSDTWSHDVKGYTKEVGAFGDAQFHVLENGPLRATIRVKTRYGASSLQIDWMLYAGTRTLEARVALDWHEHLKILKFSFPVDVQDSQATYEIPYGYKVRAANGDEDPGQRWIDVTGKRGGSAYGLAVINDAKYGYSVQGSDLRVSIARSPVYAQFEREMKPDHEYLWQDQGRQTFRMWLAPHAGDWRDAGVVRMTEELTAPTPVIYQGIHPGDRPTSASFLSVDAPNVVVSVVKQAEDSDDLIVRCYETAGRATTATVNLGLLHRQWTGSFHPLEIKTLRVPRAGGATREVNVLEE
jgi:alpha-mannosidase